MNCADCGKTIQLDEEVYSVEAPYGTEHLCESCAEKRFDSSQDPFYGEK